LSFIHA
jgi:threonyl-tRNA synthetase